MTVPYTLTRRHAGGLGACKHSESNNTICTNDRFSSTWAVGLPESISLRNVTMQTLQLLFRRIR